MCFKSNSSSNQHSSIQEVVHFFALGAFSKRCACLHPSLENYLLSFRMSCRSWRFLGAFIPTAKKKGNGENLRLELFLSSTLNLLRKQLVQHGDLRQTEVTGPRSMQFEGIAYSLGASMIHTTFACVSGENGSWGVIIIMRFGRHRPRRVHGHCHVRVVPVYYYAVWTTMARGKWCSCLTPLAVSGSVCVPTTFMLQVKVVDSSLALSFLIRELARAVGQDWKNSSRKSKYAWTRSVLLYEATKICMKNWYHQRKSQGYMTFLLWGLPLSHTLNIPCRNTNIQSRIHVESSTHLFALVCTCSEPEKLSLYISCNSTSKSSRNLFFGGGGTRPERLESYLGSDSLAYFVFFALTTIELHAFIFSYTVKNMELLLHLFSPEKSLYWTSIPKCWNWTLGYPWASWRTQSECWAILLSSCLFTSLKVELSGPWLFPQCWYGLRNRRWSLLPLQIYQSTLAHMSKVLESTGLLALECLKEITVAPPTTGTWTRTHFSHSLEPKERECERPWWTWRNQGLITNISGQQLCSANQWRTTVS